MATFNKDLPYDHAHGEVQDHEPFFFQDGFAFTHSGVEVFKDGMGNFSVLSTSLGAKRKAKVKTKAEPEPNTEKEVSSDSDFAFELISDDDDVV